MLNELYDLWQACERAEVDLPVRIEGLDEGQKKDGLRAFLRADGSISRIESVSGEQMKRIRKWSCGSGISLPVFNFEPLHVLSEADQKALKKRIEKAATPAGDDLLLGTMLPIRWEITKLQKLDRAFQRVSGDLSQKVGANADPNGEAWRTLLAILPKLKAESFLPTLSSEVSKRLLREKPQDCSLKLLFHDPQKTQASAVPVQFETEGTFSANIYSPNGQSWLVTILAETVAGGTGETEDEEERDPLAANVPEQPDCAVWGRAMGAGQKYGRVDLPVLGKASLFNRDVGSKPTSARYDPRQAIFPVGPDVRMKLMAAIEWLTDEERKRKTWAVVSKFKKPKQKGKRPEPVLLLTYLDEKMGATPEHLAEVFVGPPEEESDRTVVQFETVCADVVQALDGIPSLSSAARIQVFGLHKPDGLNSHRAQIFASESFTQSGLKLLVESWQNHCRAHPPLWLPQFTQEGEATPVRDFEPLVPFPYQAIECLNTIWEKCGKADDAKCESASDYDLADAFELLRRTGAHPADDAYLGRMLDLAVRRALPLMTGVAQAMHQAVTKQHEKKRVFLAQGDKGCEHKSLLQARRWPCLLSLLLTRIGYKLETFMKEPAYLIGRFLAQLDRLHAYYAKHVSGKEDGLRQLLGNSTMATALESPLRAFELAGQRMLPYQAWGHSFAQGRKSKDALGAASDERKATNSDRWEVHRVLEDLGRIAEELSDCGIPEANSSGLPARVGHEAKPPTKPILDLADTLMANDRAWMHSDSAAKAQMLLGYGTSRARGSCGCRYCQNSSHDYTRGFRLNPQKHLKTTRPETN